MKVDNSSSNSEVASASEEEEEEESEEEIEESREWDEYCMICEDGGNVICCEKCSHVAHLACLGLKKSPEEWICPDCVAKEKAAPRGRGASKEPRSSTKNDKQAKKGAKPAKKE